MTPEKKIEFIMENLHNGSSNFKTIGIFENSQSFWHTAIFNARNKIS